MFLRSHVGNPSPSAKKFETFFMKSENIQNVLKYNRQNIIFAMKRLRGREMSL